MNSTPRADCGDVAKLWQEPALADTVFLAADYRTQRFPRHFHEEYAFGIIESGCQTFVYDRARQIDMIRGTVALISPGIVHAGGPGMEQGWRYRMLYPSHAMVDEAVTDIFGTGAVPRFNSPGVVDLELYAAIEALHGASLRASGDVLEVQSRMVFILRTAFARHACVKPPPGTRLHHRGLQDVRELLHEGYDRNPDLQSLAAVAGLGRFQLLRQFTATFGIPPHAYLKQIRIARAQRLIVAGATLAETAAATGFSDQSHMTRVFRASRGYTPGALRRSCAIG